MEETISTIETLVTRLNSHRNSFVYRGHADAEWSLESSLERLIGTAWNAANAKKFEEYSYDEFRSRFHLYDSENRTPSSKLAWLATMQHYGVPTRLIDFTTSPYVALYFALEAYRPSSGADIAVFALDYSAAMDRSFQLLQEELPDFAETRLSHRNKQDVLFDSKVDPQARDVVWVTEPTELNKRLDRQSGCFVLSGNRGRRLAEILADPRYADVEFYKYRISATLYRGIYDVLRKANINSKTLYGDLAGLGQSLRMEMQVYASG